MKKLTNRALSVLLVLAMCLSILGGIGLTANAQTVDYVYADGIIKNWGVRGTTATFLSQNAEAFYEDNNTSYEDLAKLPGATATSDVPNSALFQELHELMFSNLDLWTSYQKQYDSTRYQYQYTDVQNSGKTNTKISSFYSGKEIGPSWDSGSTWNREHTWPNSKGTGAGGTSAIREADIMMLRPVPSNENSSRGNTAYGNGSKYFYPNTGSYDVRGDVARILLYVYTCWGGHSDATYHNGALEYMWGENGVIESKEVLLEWLEEDPVDTWELGRNDSVESITGTRNVFVDYPELGFMLFNEEIPAGYTTPSGNAGNGTAYTITAVSGNTAYGTVALNGKIITASPKTGYEVAGYTVTSGSADVVRDGNLFAVTAYSDVTVRIDFQPRSQATIKYAEYGTITNSQTVYTGDDVTLPTVKNTPQTGHTFVGWVATPTGDVETAPAIYSAGSRYTVNQNTVLYALYSRTEGSGNSSDLFEPYSGTLTEGDYIIVDKSSGTVAMVAAATDKNRLQYASISFVGDNIIAPASNIIWTLEYENNYWTMYNAAKKSYAGGTGTKNQAKLLSSVTTYAQWTVQYKTSTTYEFINRGNDAKGVNPMLRRNGEVGWACYAKNTTSGAPLYLYKRAEGTVYYFTQIGEAACLHPDAHNVNAVDPECESVGYTAGVYCPDCDEYISGHQEIPAINHAQAYEEEGKAATCTAPGYEARLYCPDCDEYLEEETVIPAIGHSYSSTVTPPQVGQQGYTTYICDNCGDSYKANYTDPLPEVTFAIVSQPESITRNPGEAASFTVVAEGEGLSYKWYYRNAGETAWKATSLTGYNTPTLSISNLNGSTHNGRQYMCKVTAPDGTVIETEPATLTVIYLINDARAQSVQIGEYAVFTVNHSDPGATYRWQYKGNTASSTWANTSATGNKTPQLTVEAKATNNRYMYRCNITLSDGTVITSKEVYLNVVEDPAEVTANPTDASAVCGDYATFTVKAAGDGLSYQWQFYNPAVGVWTNTKGDGYSTNTLRVKTNNFNSGYQYRCVVKTPNGNGWTRVYSEAATLTVLPAAEINEALPETITAKVGDTIQIHIGADGEGLTYQWQWAKFKGNWKNTSLTGATTDTLTVANVRADMNGRYYRVVITNKFGGYVETVSVQLFVE